ncbi:carbohydrate ABC transporter permease [Candidatus Aerophobetes bacterium]|nr:carbohydrate ABC transporter permease [Candidatus Aerophobetes bacterium]
MKEKQNTLTIISWILIGIDLLIVSFPLYWLFITAFKTMEEVVHRPPYFWPPSFIIDNFKSTTYGAIGAPAAILAIKDSLIVALSNSILSLFVGILAAYSIIRFRTGGDNLSFWILSNRFLPPIVFIIPLFVIFRTLHLFDTYLGLILAYCIFNIPFAVWLLMGFIQEAPKDLEEAAMIDGASRRAALFRVTVPIIAPGIAVTFLFCFLSAWNEYIMALLLTGTKINTLPVIIPKYTTAHDVLYGQMAAAAIFGIIPAFILSFILQKYLVRGLTVGAIK